MTVSTIALPVQMTEVKRYPVTRTSMDQVCLPIYTCFCMIRDRHLTIVVNGLSLDRYNVIVTFIPGGMDIHTHYIPILSSH